MPIPKWLKSPNLPSWLSAIGTIAIALVAFITLGPVIENLQLREKNNKLEDDLIYVQNQIHQAKQTLEIKKAEAESIKKSLDIAQEVLNSLNDQNVRLDSANKKLIENLEVREQERSELKGQIQQLSQEATSLQSDNASFRARNDQLKNQITSIINQLDKLKLQLTTTKKTQRSYVVETIILKAKAKLPLSEEGVYHKMPFFPDDEIYQLMVAPPSQYFSTFSNGRELIMSLYNSREFDLLKEIEGQELRREITNFMDKRQKVFNEPLIVDINFKEYWPVFMTQLYMIKKLQKGKVDKNLTAAEEKIKLKEYKKEIQRIIEAAKRLEFALDEMSKELA